MVQYLIGLMMLPVVHDIDVSHEQINCLAEAVYHESRGESKVGQALVAQTILNRVTSKNFRPNTICGIVHQKNQFEFLDKVPVEHTHNEYLWEEIYMESTRYAYSYKAGVSFVSQKYSDVAFFCTCKFRYEFVEYIGKVDNHNFFSHK